MYLRLLILGIFFVKLDAKHMKSSLTFVIDSTYSMRDEIDQVKFGAKAIFDTVVNSNNSFVEDVVLVTFKDPEVEWLLTTNARNSEAFKNALDGIVLHGNYNCPEMALDGIEEALHRSRDGSSLFVFTDASSHNLYKYDDVEELSQTMGCQIVFVITPGCSESEEPNRTEYYEKLAKATNGQVFLVYDGEFGEILKYVQNTVESRKNVITSKTFPKGRGNKFDVAVDGDTKELVIAVSGKRPSVEVTDSDGKELSTSDIARLKDVRIVKAVDAKPGVYKVEVGSDSETRVVVSGSTSVHFQYGFSGIKPSAFTETEKRPVPGETSHLCIELDTEGVNLESLSVQILLMDDSVYLEKPLNLVNKTEQFYITERITPPDESFKIAIKGYDPKTKTFITRLSLTPVKVQRRPALITNKVPVVSIDGGPKINTKYDHPLQLKCRVSGYPPPKITWESDDKTELPPYTSSTVKIPYDYISVLDKSSVRKNSTYFCKAVNSAGNSEGSIAVKINTFFRPDPHLLPSDKTIEYQKRAEIPCKVEALPPATVTWYKGGEVLKPDKNLELSADGSILIVRSMEPDMDDNYICEVRNSAGRRVVPFKLTITGVDPPEINKDTSFMRILRGSRATIECKVIKGHPKPVMLWMYKGVDDTEFEERYETTDSITFDKVESSNAGQYRCVAENEMGWDIHEVELFVEYKPEISREFASRITANHGDDVTLRCLAKGVPRPDITWKFNGVVIRRRKYTFFRDGGIRFSATSSDEGTYECEARNPHGIDSISVDLDVTIPVEIESPKESFIRRMVGTDATLLCRADGSPKPRIEWVFRRSGKFDPRRLLPSDATGDLRLPRIQLTQNGTYTCVATNSINSKNITYVVSVLAPPYITYKTKQFRAVVDDMHLRIPCKATGNPEPDITWTHDGYDIASGSEWYDIADDGSLIIKNIKKDSEGVYTCTASNLYGQPQEMFNVVVDPYPHPGFLSHSVMIEKDSSVTIPCSVPHMKTDRLRWYKDGHLVSSSELFFRNVTQSNAGTYTCRVSFVNKPAQSGSTKVEVGFNPRFTYPDHVKNLTFEKDNFAVMDCTATAVPEPQVKWFHDGKEIRFTEFTYYLEMTEHSDRGTYTCEVTNRFGIARREFVILSSECLLDIKHDFNENEPLMMTSYDEVMNFDNSDGYLHIPKDEKIKLVCPSGFNSIRATEITVTCDSEQQFIHQPLGSRYSYSDLKCRYKLKPIVRRTGNRCTNGDSEMLNIGFEIESGFKEIYQVCLDRYSKNPIYTKLNMQSSLANVGTDDKEWFYYDSPTDVDSIYECYYQNSEISAILDKEFHRDDRCCFARRMLVNPKDVAPGLPQAATFTHLNVAPHWSSCNSKNWEDIEQRIRNLTLSSYNPLQVWTGVAEDLRLQDAHYKEKDIVLNSRGKEIQVPKFLWKVVQDPDAKASLAIIQVNVPDLNSREAAHYRLCTDICEKIEWLKSSYWRTVERGYTYCCSLADFEREFRFYGVFPSYKNLLSYAYLSESYA